MKKLMIILLMVIGSTTLAISQTRPMAGTMATINGVTVFPVGTLNDGSIPVTTAVNYINNYNSDKVINKSALSFVFNAGDLLGYLTEYNSPIENFFLAEGGTSNQLYLLIAPIDNLGQHYYYSMDNKQTCNVLGSCQDCPNIPASFEYEQSTLTTYYLEAMSFQNADSMVAAYNKYINTIPAPKKITSSSWLYNGLDLIGYIQNGIANGMKYVQFSLAINSSNKIDLIISGSSDGATHMYFMYNGDPCVMENCYPCPTCKAYKQGTTLEPNCGK